MPYSGSIVEHETVVYFVPTDTETPLLEWNAHAQRFDVVIGAADEATRARVESVRSLAHLASSPIRITNAASNGRADSAVSSAADFPSDSATVSRVTPCEALYGVLSLGTTDAVLLYVTEKKHVASLTIESVNKPHDIFLVKSLEWRPLPAVPIARRSVGHNDDDTDVEDGTETDKSSGDDDGEEEDGGSQPGGRAACRLPADTLRCYHDVVAHFCAYVTENGGAHSFLYFCPTLNLAENPKDIIDTQLWSRPNVSETGKDDTQPQPSSAEDGEGGAGTETPSATTEKPQNASAVFRWNASLLQAFQSITPTLQGGNWRPLPAGVTALDGAATTNVSAFYVPSFIRGLARTVTTADTDRGDGAKLEMTMVTRLSARFAGTRYNRRGLEHGLTGVCANMAMTALWVSYHGTDAPRRIAVYEVLRGSVPRRWTQPANLAFKPPIRLSSTTSAVRELRSHLDLLTRLFPQYDRYYCIDTTSTSKLEKPLSDTFANTVARLRSRDPVSAGLGNASALDTPAYADRFFYLKYNVKQKKQKMKYGQMRLNLVTIVEESLEEPSVEASSSVGPAASPWDGFLLYEEIRASDGAVPTWQLLKEQVVLARVNCLDNLDRTNLTQSMIVTTVLPRMLKSLTRPRSAEGTPVPETETATRQAARVKLEAAAESAALSLFASQGVAISQLYAGTDPHYLNYMLGAKSGGAIDSFSEGFLALRRWYNNNFYDGRKQDAVSLLTGQHSPVSYAAHIENPFSRDLSSMNRLVLCGVVVGLVALVLSVVSFLIALDAQERRIRALFAVLWLLYNVVLFKRIAPYQQSFTNNPLLPYTP